MVTKQLRGDDSGIGDNIPSLCSAVRDDHALLLRGELKEMAEAVSVCCLTVEEWAESALASEHCEQVTFGYEREHYEVSKAVGERKLFPAIRDRESDSTVVAPGFSCRQQIEHFTNVHAVSAVQVIEPLVNVEAPD